MRRRQARRYLVRDLLFIAAGVAIAMVLVRVGALDAVLDLVGRTDAAAFVAGIFFTSAFTLAPASIALVKIAEIAPFWETALWGALGAVVGDLVIFCFIRDRFADDLMRSLKPSINHHILSSFHLGFLKWLAPVLGALIIASPLPDEFGLVLMGISKTRVAVLIPISFAMNWLGIYLVVWLAQVI